ncbi:MAG TPA: type II toxin-antitoxin system prevent-host-death family antitoxin [Terriglobia bacterium]|nr:type II toxin-antitoxin system prevent-host-death family antitoxin [Terriglobia bacterium]
MAISKFKPQCNAVIERVRRTRKPILITRFGKPVAEVLPPLAPKSVDWLGSLAGTGRIVGDIVSPASHESDWEALR